MKIPKQEEGQGLVEYALLLVLVAIVIIGILTVLGSSITVVYAKVIGGLNGQTVTGQGIEAIVTGYDANITQGTGGCSGTVSNISFIGLDDGNILKSGTVSIKILVDGATVSTLSGGTVQFRDGNSGRSLFSFGRQRLRRPSRRRLMN
jgi:pilus assembly protein Flp/PilA